MLKKSLKNLDTRLLRTLRKCELVEMDDHLQNLNQMMTVLHHNIKGFLCPCLNSTSANILCSFQDKNSKAKSLCLGL